MRERKNRYQIKELDITNNWHRRTRLSAVHRTGILATITYFFSDGGSYGTSPTYISNKEFANSIAIIFVSAAAFGIGLGQLFLVLFKG